MKLRTCRRNEAEEIAVALTHFAAGVGPGGLQLQKQQRERPTVALRPIALQGKAVIQVTSCVRAGRLVV